MQVYIDGILITTWTSSGTTTLFEGVDLSGSNPGQAVELRGVLADSDWLSISEVILPYPVRFLAGHAGG